MNLRTRNLSLLAVVIVILYCTLVFGGYALMFGIYQFLRDHGYGFWQTCAILTGFAAVLAVPALVKRVYK